MEDMIPSPLGGHSSAGRATNRGMDKMRVIAVQLQEQEDKLFQSRKEAAERIAAERKLGATGAQPGAKVGMASPTGASSPPTVQEDSTPTTPPAMKKRMPRVPGGQEDKSTAIGRAIREKLNLNNPGSPAAAAPQTAEAQSPTGVNLPPKAPKEDEDEDDLPLAKIERASPAFLGPGMQDQIINEPARTQLKRFFIQGANWPANPDVGQYKINENATRHHTPAHNLDHTQGHQFGISHRNGMEKSNEFGPEDLTTLDFTMNKSGSMFINPSSFSEVKQKHSQSMGCASYSDPLQTWKGGSLMSASSSRPPLGNIPGNRMGCTGVVKMTDMTFCGEPHEQDKLTTNVQRPPEWDMSTQMARKGGMSVSGCKYFEPGKYAANHDVVKTNPKKMTGFDKQLPRSAMDVTKQKPPASQDCSKNGTWAADRSQYRFNQIARPMRITHVMEMHKDLDRPPLVVHAKAPFDDSNPEIVKKVMERAMSFNADTVTKAVEPRTLQINMEKGSTRETATKGSRVCQNDVGVLSKNGLAGYETTGQLTASVTKLKDSNRLRGDLGMTFDQHKFRHQTRMKAEYSSLFRPRDQAAPEFSRPAEDGFQARTFVRVLQRSRTHEAMPGWTAEAVDGLMNEDDSPLLYS